MKKPVLWSLVLLNAVLAGAFLFRLFPDNAAHAQANRRPGDYVMIPGALGAGSAAIIYVLDTSTGQLSAMSYDEPRNDIAMMAPLNLSRVFAAGETINGGTDRKRR